MIQFFSICLFMVLSATWAQAEAFKSTVASLADESKNIAPAYGALLVESDTYQVYAFYCTSQDVVELDAFAPTMAYERSNKTIGYYPELPDDEVLGEIDRVFDIEIVGCERKLWKFFSGFQMEYYEVIYDFKFARGNKVFQYGFNGVFNLTKKQYSGKPGGAIAPKLIDEAAAGSSWRTREDSNSQPSDPKSDLSLIHI